jgi:hypothetical protein
MVTCVIIRNWPVRTVRKQNQYSFWLKYFASVEVIQAAVKPVVSEYDAALEEQQRWVNQWRVLSPAVLMQNSLNELAGTSTGHYQYFRKQLLVFSEAWRSYFTPRMFKNERMQPEDIANPAATRLLSQSGYYTLYNRLSRTAGVYCCGVGWKRVGI